MRHPSGWRKSGSRSRHLGAVLGERLRLARCALAVVLSSFSVPGGVSYRVAPPCAQSGEERALAAGSSLRGGRRREGLPEHRLATLARVLGRGGECPHARGAELSSGPTHQSMGQWVPGRGTTTVLAPSSPQPTMALPYAPRGWWADFLRATRRLPMDSGPRAVPRSCHGRWLLPAPRRGARRACCGLPARGRPRARGGRARPGAARLLAALPLPAGRGDAGDIAPPGVAGGGATRLASAARWSLRVTSTSGAVFAVWTRAWLTRTRRRPHPHRA